jgi:hypothetical protein
MKWLAATCLILFSCAALADDASKAAVKPLHQTPPNVEIINGKRFFSLQNVRRFNGDTNNPKALSVLHHPRSEGALMARNGRRLPPPSPATPAAGAPGLNKPDSDKVLSIFAPEDKRLASPGATK